MAERPQGCGLTHRALTPPEGERRFEIFSQSSKRRANVPFDHTAERDKGGEHLELGVHIGREAVGGGEREREERESPRRELSLRGPGANRRRGGAAGMRAGLLALRRSARARAHFHFLFLCARPRTCVWGVRRDSADGRAAGAAAGGWRGTGCRCRRQCKQNKG